MNSSSISRSSSLARSGNPITHLVRRLSKTLSLSRSSVTSDHQDDLEESSSYHPRVRLFSSLRDRASRSTPKRPTTMSVIPPPDSPAPLAPADSFDTSHASDVEKEAKPQPQTPTELESGSTTPYESSDTETTEDDAPSSPATLPVFSDDQVKSKDIYNFEYPQVEREVDQFSEYAAIKTDSSASQPSLDITESEMSYSEEEQEVAETIEEKKRGQDVNDNYDDEEDKVEEMEQDEDEFQDQNNYQYDEDYPQFEVEHDPQQDPFHEATLAAEEAGTASYGNEVYYDEHHGASPKSSSYLTSSIPPTIMVTSPSNNEITQKTSPSRPPPPSNTQEKQTSPLSRPTEPHFVPLPPKEVEANSKPSVVPQGQPPPIPPPPRPQTAPKGPEDIPSPSKKKKHKILGINVGPLPSDPDPSFPFQSHFEKKRIIPNPKKALRNIIGGEKRKQRLKRKEEAEVERIIKSGGGGPKKQVVPTATSHNDDEKAAAAANTTKGYLSDWYEFQARIEATVNDTTSRLESLKWIAEVENIVAREPSAKPVETTWANFEARRDTKVAEDWAEFHREETEKPVPEDNEEPDDQEEFNKLDQLRSSALEETEKPTNDDWANFDTAEVGDTESHWAARYQASQPEAGWAAFVLEPTPTNPAEENWAAFPQESQQAEKAYEEDCVGANQEDNPTTADNWTTDPFDRRRKETVSISRTELSSPVLHSFAKFFSHKQEEPEKLTENEQAPDPPNEFDLFQEDEPTIEVTVEETLAQKLKTQTNWTEPFSKGEEATQRPYSSASTMSSQEAQMLHYEYAEGSSSQITTEVCQSSSSDQPTVIEENPAPSNSTAISSDSTASIPPNEPEYPVEYGYDNETSTPNDEEEEEEQQQQRQHEQQIPKQTFGSSYGYDAQGEMSESRMDRFVSDVIQSANEEAAKEEIPPEIKNTYINNKLPGSNKGWKVRQGTVTENNPFRKASRAENADGFDENPNPEEDEKTTLATVTLFSQAVTDDDDLDEVNDVECEATTPSNMQVAGFDPFQTIYPTSEKGSSDEEEEEVERAFPEVSIKDASKEDQVKVFTATVPILPAPPKAAIPGSIEKNHCVIECDESDILSGLALKESVPVGWETFGEALSKDDTQRDEALQLETSEDELVKAFEVDWETPPAPVASVPEPPRPETPDPDLEIPFNTPVPAGQVWRLWLRFPEKKKKLKQKSKYTTDRNWKDIAVTLSDDRGRCEVNLHEIDEATNEKVDQPFQTLRMEPYMQLSRCKLQQYDKYGKLNIFKINHVTYRELPGMRPEKFSIKTFQNLISHKPKQNVALDHIPVYTEILKFGSMDRPLMRSLMTAIEDSLMRIPAHKDEGLNYSHEEICCYVIDEYIGKISEAGIIEEQKACTRIFCSAFVNGGPHIVLGINDKWRFGREVVRRSDILPVMHDDWITIWKPEFHSCLEMDDYANDHMLRFYPLDGCKFELMRFRVSLRQNRELPMQVHCCYSIDDRRVSMRCDLLVPGYFTATGRSEAVPCEDVEIRIPVPEEWIYHFRVEKHHKMGSVHSTLRKPGRIKGLERITQMAQSLLPPSLMEASIGLAKYEHIFKAIVWRISRVPEKHEASYRPHLLTCNLLLNPHDTVPEWDTLVKDVHVEFNMPSSTISGTTVRSISVETTGNAEKFVKYTAKYRVTKEISYKLGNRNEIAIKGILDKENDAEIQESSSEEEEPEEEEEEDVDGTTNGEPKEDKEEEGGGVAEDDLLGGNLPAPSPSVSRASKEPSNSTSNDLVDIFG